MISFRAQPDVANLSLKAHEFVNPLSGERQERMHDRPERGHEV